MSGPPELPGLIAASVWIAGKTVAGSVERLALRRDRTVQRADDAGGDGALETERRTDGDDLLADGQVVGVAERRRGEVVLTSSAWITARSVSGSRPTMVAFAVVPSLKLTASSPPSAAISTTWLLVRIWPSSVKMMPEPEPLPCWPAGVDLDDRGQRLGGGGLRCRRRGAAAVRPTWLIVSAHWCSAGGWAWRRRRRSRGRRRRHPLLRRRERRRAALHRRCDPPCLGGSLQGDPRGAAACRAGDCGRGSSVPVGRVC